MLNQQNSIMFINTNNMNYISGGTVLFKRLFSEFDAEKLVLYIVGSVEGKRPEWLNRFKIFEFPISIMSMRYLRYFRKVRLINLVYVYFKEKFLFLIIKDIIEKCKLNKIKKVWIYAVAHNIIIASKLIADGIPVHLSIQDDIDGHLYKTEANYLRKYYEYSLRNAASVDVVSVYMKDYLIEKYKLKREIFVFTNGMIESDIPYQPLIKKEINKIGFAGNIWAKDTIRYLISGINEYNRKYNKSLYLIIFSNQKIMSSEKWVKYYRMIDNSLIDKELKECDLLYVPMSFKGRYKILSSTSLPGKIITYLKNQIPIISHGPEYAANIKIVREKEIGYCICEKNKSIIAKELKKINDSIESRVEVSNKMRINSVQYLGNNSLLESFYQVLFS